MSVLSYGGGLDSFAVLLRAIQLGDKPDVAVFCDVSNGSPAADPTDPGEWPGTYRHIREIVMPLCAREGVEFVWLTTDAYPVRDARSLYAWLQARRQIPIAADKTKRICSRIAKVERFERWMAERYGDAPVDVWLGFEAGEEDRAANDPNIGKAAQRRNRFPLMEWSMCRCRCEAFVRELGYPVPRKSACVFCPLGSKGDWITFSQQLPEQFDKIVELEHVKPPTRKGKKLTIMGWSSRTQTGKALPLYVASGYRRPKPEPCNVCGAAVRATKATGCNYLAEATAEAA